MQVKPLTVNSLTNEQYARSFSFFAERSHEYDDMIDFLINFIENQGIRRMDILSIGTGNGQLEEEISRQLYQKISISWCIEPNLIHVNELLKKNFEDVIVTQEYLTESIGRIPLVESTMIDKKFDLVLMSHCLYLMPNPIEMIIKATTFLKPDGQLIIFHQTSTGMCEFVNRFWPKLDFIYKPLADHSLSLDKILLGLQDNPDLNIISGYMSSWIDITDVIAGDSDVTHELLTFFSQTDTRKLPSKIFNDMIFDLKVNIFDENKYHHPVGVIIITRKN